ncbi:alpha/beta hydrolase [Dactylosporangium aurantiacum]|uniref:Alpha/beta hydrolase n=1 Tax=Dactylosporangium aurantiacum TaxID=35754 RepID=A0A9Q9IHD8_9ACTN|nr:alpha/beta hydrolase [Dactylosporangium aurantiacum]MDG6110180.1 alpha/beta hydrolase [Dactylosporangium aurantiacum]UWZ54200.1 alpha/beta hydrolase [Dactylosporangium aurantiacum]
MKRASLVPEFTVPSPDRLPERWPGREVELDGLKAYVRDTPATAPGAEPAVYVHGLGGSSTNWTDLAGVLSDRLEGQAVDLPGFGHSGPARSYSLTAMAAHVIRWIEHSDRGPVHLFGNSMGGAAVVVAAALRPDLVRSLTLISPAMPFLDPRRSLQGPIVPLLLLPNAAKLAARRMSSMDPEELAAMVIESCYADPTRYPEQRRLEAIEEARLRHSVPWYAEAYVASLRGLVGSFLRAYLPGQGSMWKIAARITAPTLVIAGRQDRLVDIRTAPQLARLVPDSRLMMLEGVGHVAQMEVPRTVARAVLGLLDELQGAAGQGARQQVATQVRDGVRQRAPQVRMAS